MGILYFRFQAEGLAEARPAAGRMMERSMRRNESYRSARFTKSRMHASAAHGVSPTNGSSVTGIKALRREAWDIPPPQVVKVAGIAGALALLAACNDGPPLKAPSPDEPISTVRYQCQQNRTIVADFYDGPSRTGADGRPIPGGRVLVQLSDGRKFSLPQTLSGSGIRYADSSESLVFWSKGDTAFVEEGPSKAVTYRDCVSKKA